MRSRMFPAFVAMLMLLVVVAACGDDDDDDGARTPAGPTATPISGENGSGDDGSTPLASQPSEGGYALEQIAPWADFDSMLGYAMYPGADDEAILITRQGELWRVGLERELAEPFGDVSDRIRSGNEEGLLGIAFSPDFEVDNAVYLYYTVGAPEPSRLSRFRVDDDMLAPESEQVLLEVPQPYVNHNGGQLAFGPDGYLYVALGDGGSGGDPEGNGQDLGTLLGAILRLDVSGDTDAYAIPADNPFVDRADARPEIFAYGLRNPWRFSFDAATGELWIADVGQDDWEEIDRGVAGGNYGWNVTEGFECFRSSDCDEAGLELPRAAYSHEDGNCSVTGGYVYRGEALEELVGWYVYADFCSGRMWALDTTTGADPVRLMDDGPQILTWGVLPDGELVAVTFEGLFRLVRDA